MSSTLALLVSSFALGAYGYAIYFMATDSKSDQYTLSIRSITRQSITNSLFFHPYFSQLA